ncbi:hypothetical protein [Sphingomonas sp.]|uniref:hypothetical protein n=1 Tax=Sphingomonas sp. TaxID=28214 RepID=UPI003D6D5CA6
MTTEQKINPDADGLIVGNPDVTTAEEIAAFRAYYDRTKGRVLPGFEFLLEHRPDVLKRYRAGVRVTTSPEWRSHPLQMVLQHLHQYVISAYGDGIIYQVHVAQNAGASKAMVLDVLSIAFLHSGPRGLNYAATEAGDYIRDYADPAPGKWPEGWGFEANAFHSGMDFASPGASNADIDALRDWHMRTTGEIPKHVDYLAKYSPDLLKAWRNRYEHCIRALPKQMMPYLLLNYNVSRGFADGIRENVLLGKAFGMTKQQLTDPIAWSLYYGGVESYDLIERVVGDVLDSMR